MSSRSLPGPCPISSSGRRFAAADLRVAEELAVRVGVAMMCGMCGVEIVDQDRPTAAHHLARAAGDVRFSEVVVAERLELRQQGRVDVHGGEASDGVVGAGDRNDAEVGHCR